MEASSPTPAINTAINRLAGTFHEALSEMDNAVDFSGFEIIDVNALTRVQLGSILIVLRKILENKREISP